MKYFLPALTIRLREFRNEHSPVMDAMVRRFTPVSCQEDGPPGLVGNASRVRVKRMSQTGQPENALPAVTAISTGLPIP